MDVVYVLKKQSDYTELYYSLRSLTNVPHNKVYICGPVVPRFTRNVFHIPASERGVYRSERVFNKLLTICMDPLISDDFILMNDDFYIMKPVETIPYLYKGTIARHLQARYRSKLKTLPLTKIIERDFSLEDKDFEMHSPIIINKKKFLDMVDFYHITTMHLYRSLYCKHYNIEGELSIDYKLKNRAEIKKAKRDKPIFTSSRGEVVRDDLWIRMMGKMLPKGYYVR